MKHTTLSNIRFLTLAASMALVPALYAADPIQVPWNELCKVANSRQLAITMANGDTVVGTCMSINVDELAIHNSANRSIVKIARSALQRIQITDLEKGHQLRALRRGVHEHLRQGANLLLSPRAPGGLFMIPSTLAWGWPRPVGRRLGERARPNPLCRAHPVT